MSVEERLTNPTSIIGYHKPSLTETGHEDFSIDFVDDTSRMNKFEIFKLYAFRTKKVKVSPTRPRELEQRLGAFQLSMMGIGASIGMGIFVWTGVLAKSAGVGVIFSFLFAGISCFFDALCYAEMAARYPISGSSYLYTYCCFGELPAVIVGLNLLLDYHIGAATISRSLSSYFIEFLRGLSLDVPEFLSDIVIGGPLSINILAPFVVTVLTAILCLGMRESSWVNTFLTSMKIMFVLVVSVAGITKLNTENWNPLFPYGISKVLSTSALAFFSYIGFDVIANAAEECRNPNRDIVLAVIITLTVCTGLYILMILVLTGMIMYSEIDSDAPFSSAFEGYGIDWVQDIIDIGAVFGLATTLLLGLYAQSRLYLGIARDGLIPSILSKINPRTHVPQSAQILCGIIASFLSLFFDVSLLSHMLSIGVILSYAVACTSVIYLRTSNQSETAKYLFMLTIFTAFASVSFRFHFHWLIQYFLIGIVGFYFFIFFPYFGHINYSVPSTFACPFVPAVPLLGLLMNIYMMVQLHWAAWVRLLCWTVIITSIYFYASTRQSLVREPMKNYFTST